MRTISFFWFWSVCWDEERAWTLIFALMVPVTAIVVLAEVLRCLGFFKISSLSLLGCIATTGYLNEIIIKTAIGARPLENSCDDGFSAPSTAAAIACAAFVLYIVRALTKPRDFLFLIAWAVAFVLSFVSGPMLSYVTWGYQAVCLVPGVVVGLVWAFLFEKRFFSQIFMPLGIALKAENDITDETFQPERNLLAS